MTNFLNLIKEHKWAIILAILVGIIMAAPHIYFIIDNQDTYQGIFMVGLDEGPYLSRIQESRDGHYWLSNPFWAEGKDNPYLWPPLPENFASFFGKILGLGLINTVLFENFAFPFFLFLILYALIYQLTEKKSFSLFSSFLIMLTPNLTDPQALWQLIANQKTTDTFLVYSRLISPQVHSLFLFGFFLSFLIFLKKKNWIIGILSGIILGLSFYVYPFTWMFIASFLFFLVLIFIFKKEWVEIKNIIWISLIALLIALPFLINLLQAMQSEFYPEVSFRYGWVKSHSPQIGVTSLILLGSFLLFFPKKSGKKYDFSLAIVLTPLILLNQQIITGYFLGPARYHNYYYKPFALIFILIIIYSLIKKTKKFFIWKGLVLLLILLSVFNAYLVQKNSYITYESFGIESQKYAPVFDWLNQNSQKDEVVLANSYLSDLVPIYTSLNAMANLDAHYSLTSNQELSERMFLLYRLDGIGRGYFEETKEIFYSNRERISKDIYAQKYQEEFGSYEMIPDEKIDLLIKGYFNSLAVPTKDVLEKYQVKYLIWDILEDPNWKISQYPFLEEVYQKNNLKIYRNND